MEKCSLLFMTPDKREVLCAEARYLHRSLFYRYPTENLVDAYLRAHIEIPDLRAIDTRQLGTVNLVVKHSLDAVGIEPWLRVKVRRHALSAKLLLIAYLAECDAGHPEFVRHVTGGWLALASMGNAVLISIFRLLRGRIQKAWHGLV